MKKDLGVLFFCVFVVMIGYGLGLPLLPYYIEKLATDAGETSGRASFHVGAITGVFAFAQFVFAPLFGRWSDRFGRRPFFLTGLAGYAVSSILFGLSATLTTLYASRILGGVLSAATLSMATVYVADVTSEKERARYMAWLGSAIGLGVVAGPALGGLLSQYGNSMVFAFRYMTFSSLSVPFFVAALLSLVALAVAAHWLPESIARPDPAVAGYSEDIRERKTLFSTISAWLLPYLALAFVSKFALTGFEGTFALHAKLLAGFGPSRMGWVFMTCGFVMAAGQAGIAARLTTRVGEAYVLCMGFLLMGFGLALLMSTERFMFILSYVALLALGMAFVAPTLASLVSKSAGERQGAVLGQLTAVGSLAQAGGPLTGGLLFAWQVHAFYLLSAFLLMAAAVYTLATIPRSR